jgi:hypothetical protein
MGVLVGMARKQRALTIDFLTGGDDQLARCEEETRKHVLGRLVTNALLCRAGLRLLADQSPDDFLAAVQRQLAVEYRRHGLPDDDPDPGKEGESVPGAA